MKSIRLKKNEDRRLLRGHLWTFSNEIASIEGAPAAGELVRLLSFQGHFLGIGFYHPHSLIAVRLLTRNDEPVDDAFFRRRLERALALRTALYPGETTYRLVHGEADLLPGLIVDRFDGALSLQVLSAGMEERTGLLCDILTDLVGPAAIVERNDSPLRILEGLAERKGILRGEAGAVTITEHGLRYEVDILGGQKTGFFLDQRENRGAIRRYAAGRRVLDCFCNEGGFSLNAAAGGAVSVKGIDIAEAPLARAARNAEANGLADRVSFTAGDVFDLLKGAVAAKEEYDLVILDPPSFTKSRKTVKKALHGYRALHRGALQLIAGGGFLATASCSHHLYEETFREVIEKSAIDCGRQLTLLEWRGAAPDHPVLPGMPETAYLKFGVFRVD